MEVPKDMLLQIMLRLDPHTQTIFPILCKRFNLLFKQYYCNQLISFAESVLNFGKSACNKKWSEVKTFIDKQEKCDITLEILNGKDIDMYCFGRSTDLLSPLNNYHKIKQISWTFSSVIVENDDDINMMEYLLDRKNIIVRIINLKKFTRDELSHKRARLELTKYAQNILLIIKIEKIIIKKIY